jgi:nitric oxide reductase NorQ protein
MTYTRPSEKDAKATRIEEYRIIEEPYYRPQGDEISLAQAAYTNMLPLLLKGPTGCGKTRFMEYMAWRLKRPLITVSCHDDLSTSDLVGRYLIRSGETVWTDGPLALAVKVGGICYLDEIVEARKETTVVIHPLADDRRTLPVEKRGEILHAPREFMLAISYNPGYQSVLKDLKPSTRQRFVALEFRYPEPALESEIVAHEAHISEELSGRLVQLAELIRNLRDQGLPEGASTRLLIHAGQLIHTGVPARKACEVAICQPLTDDHEILAGLMEMIQAIF